MKLKAKAEAYTLGVAVNVGTNGSFTESDIADAYKAGYIEGMNVSNDRMQRRLDKASLITITRLKDKTK